MEEPRRQETPANQLYSCEASLQEQYKRCRDTHRCRQRFRPDVLLAEIQTKLKNKLKTNNESSKEATKMDFGKITRAKKMMQQEQFSKNLLK